MKRFDNIFLIFLIFLNSACGYDSDVTVGEMKLPNYEFDYIKLSQIEEYPNIIVRKSDYTFYKKNYKALPENSEAKKSSIVRAWFSDDENDRFKATEEFKKYWKNYSKKWDIPRYTSNTFGDQVKVPDGVALRGIWRTVHLYDLVRGFGYLTNEEINEYKNRLVQVVENSIGSNPDMLNLPGEEMYSWRHSNMWSDVAISAGMVALAFPELPQSEKWINFAVNEILWMLEEGTWDGAWHECPRYHLYEMKTVGNFFICLYNRTGINFFQHPAIHALAKWCVDFSTPKDIVAGKEAGCPDGVIMSPGIGDSLWGENMGILNIFAPFVSETDEILAQEMVWTWKNSGHRFSQEAVTDLYINPDLPSVSPKLGSKVSNIKGHILMRSNPNTDEDIWMLLKCGRVSMCGHENGDANSFSLFAYGVPMSLDSGSGDYNDPNHRKWNKKSISHNVVVFRSENESDFDKYNDSKWEDGHIIKWESNEKYDYSITDASYANDVKKYFRHVLFIKPYFFVVWDEIESDRESSFMLHSPCKEIKWYDNRIVFDTHENTQLEVVSILPLRSLVPNEYSGQIGAWTYKKAKTDCWYQFRTQKFIEIRGFENEDYLTLLYPKKSNSGDIDVKFNTVDNIIKVKLNGLDYKISLSNGMLNLE